ncbi:MAG: hypothetical protein RR397_04940 [Odoribacter sp.]
MKRVVLYLLFIFTIVWGWNTIGKSYASVEKNYRAEKSISGEATQNLDRTISVLLAANSYADISLQPTNPVNSCTARRYRPAGFSFDKLQSYLSLGKNIALENTFKIILGSSLEYAARQKNAGYYIYTLRKIII